MIGLDKLNHLPQSPLERLLNSLLKIFKYKNKSTYVSKKNQFKFSIQILTINYIYLYKAKWNSI